MEKLTYALMPTIWKIHEILEKMAYIYFMYLYEITHYNIVHNCASMVLPMQTFA